MFWEELTCLVSLGYLKCLSNGRKTANMVWTYKENARYQTATEHFRIGTRGNVKKGKTQRKME
jgi:N6-adenosine-specific RNA methylase IME4